MHNNFNRFKVSALALAVGSVLSAPLAMAQTSDENVGLEEVVVTGIRSSLKQAADIKREASGVVDAISSEDIGKFPDTNLAESLQRITGVSIDRTNNEGNQVTVRGFGPQFNLVTLNGRQLPNSSALKSTPVSRSFNFREIAAESVSGVEVYKTGQAKAPSGGIGATINIKTARPLDIDGFKATVSGKAVIDTSVEKGDDVTPEFGGMISYNIDDKVGVLLSASQSERHYHVDRVGTQFHWNTGYPWSIGDIERPAGRADDAPTWSVPTMDVDQADYERERTNAQLVFQVAPTDNLKFTLDKTISRLEDRGEMNRVAYWFDNYQEAVTDNNGTAVEVFRADESLTFWAWEYAFVTENESDGLNIEFAATDSLTFNLDYHQSVSHSNPGLEPAERVANLNNISIDHDGDVSTGNADVIDVRAFFEGTLPRVDVDDSRLPGGAYARQNLQADLYQERGFEVKNEITQLQLDGVYQTDGALSELRFGYAETEYDVRVNDLQEESFALRNGALDISDLNMNFVPGRQGFSSMVEYSAAEFIDLVDAQGVRGSRNITTNSVGEKTSAAFVSAEFDFSPLTLNLGLRYEETDVEAVTFADPVVGFHYLTESELSPIRLGEVVNNTRGASYSHVLPNLDIAFDINEDMVLRASASKTIARSTIDALYPALPQITNRRPQSEYTATRGNAALDPYDATNYDLSFEYYYDEGSYASIGYFYKDVDNFIATASVEEAIVTTSTDLNSPNGELTDPSTNPRDNCPTGDTSNAACESTSSDPVINWEVSRPINLNATTVDGIEFNIQHMFGDTGFGTIANYTYVSSDDEFNPNSLDNDFSITGLSDSANLVLFYENHGLQARVAYNWRDKFLLRTNGSNPTEPVFTAAYEQIDVNASYDVNDYIQVFVEGLNVTDEATHRHGRWSNQIVDYEEYGPRYNVGVRATF